MSETLAAALLGFVLDRLLGDPESLSRFHPVVLMGRCITALEKRLRRVFPATERGELAAGALLVLVMALGTYAVSAALLAALDALCPPLGFGVRVLWSWQVLAARDLADESERVRRALEHGTLEQARAAVGRIVGRDTAALDGAGVARAAVETVAENFSDGVVAPLLYLLLGGAPLALTYKAVNTMDSMLGYKNERYLYFGRAAARLDDAANLLPSRLAALLLIAAAPLGCDAGGAWRVWRRDRRNHASPNSAQTEAAMAGALGLRLGGPASYFGKRVEKPAIGDERRPITPEDIRRANRLMMAGSALALALLCLARLTAELLLRNGGG